MIAELKLLADVVSVNRLIVQKREQARGNINEMLKIWWKHFKNGTLPNQTRPLKLRQPERKKIGVLVRLFARGDFSRKWEAHAQKNFLETSYRKHKINNEELLGFSFIKYSSLGSFSWCQREKFIHRGSPSSSSSSDASFEVYIHEFMMFRRSFFSRSASSALTQKARSHEATLKLWNIEARNNVRGGTAEVT